MQGRSRRGPLPLEAVVGARPSWRDPRWWRGRLLWLEQRPAERGRTTLLLGGGPEQAPRELTPGPWNLRSRAHEYGGGAWCLDGDTAVFVHDGDRALWRLDLAGAEAAGEPVPVRLTPEAPDAGGRAFADGLIDRHRHRWIGVLEQDGRDQLVAVPLAGGDPQPLWQPVDFCGYAALSPSGRLLAWVEWQRPHMPWERSRLWLARIGADGTLRGARPLAGSGPGDGRGVSVFQPLWAGPDLVVANDRSGWWNLERLANAEARADELLAGQTAWDLAGPEPGWEPLLPMAAEFGQPQWIFGLRTIAWDGRTLLASACREGHWQLGRVRPGAEPTWQPSDLPFDDLETLVAAAGQVAAIAAGPQQAAGLLELEIESGAWRHTPADQASAAVAADASPAEALWFAGHGGQLTHAWLHPAAAGDGPHTPLLLRAHSGPTGMARTGLNPAIQFWTSRGWSVLDVNYGGSTGFGRAYRERLDGQWGVVDVADCAAAARAVVAAGRADPERVAMEGGSAAGFTVLALLCFETVLRAGACRYPVTDLTALTGEGHRFEERYFDTLIGPWPEARASYLARSPLHHAERITAPVLLFHGLDDRVVPPAQSERLARVLSERGVPVELHLFPGEGHGFRDGAVQRRVLEATELFFRRRFGL